MSLTGTQTTTFTVADIRKVVDKFSADFTMIAQATGLLTRESVQKTISDLKVLAEHKYLIDVKLILKDSNGNQVQAAVYKVSEAATGWQSDRPGNNLWPSTPGGGLTVVAGITDGWWGKTETEKVDFVRNTHMHSIWTRSAEDTTFAGLTKSDGQRYASNGYGWERKNFTK